MLLPMTTTLTTTTKQDLFCAVCSCLAQPCEALFVEEAAAGAVSPPFLPSYRLSLFASRWVAAWAGMAIR